jgi:hypothetical protein
MPFSTLRASSTVRPSTAVVIIDADDWLMEQPWPPIRISEMVSPSNSR